MTPPNSSSLKRPLPTSSASTTAANQANPSTPANTASGTTPRSIATPNAHSGALLSPAATRLSLGKSPKPPSGPPSAAKSTLATGATNSAANTPQLSSSHASKHLPPGSTGLSHGSPAVLVGTPGLSTGANGVGFNSPGIHDALGMGISMSNMGVPMGLSASSLGLGLNLNLATGSSMGPGKMGDDERRRRLEAVLSALGQRTGRVSQAGLEQLGRRLGLDLAWDLFPDLKIGNGRMLSLSGVSSMQVDVEFEDRRGAEDGVARVALTYHGLSEAVEAGARPASRILYRDLLPAKGQAAITLTLDRFAANLERLSRLDKLSVPGANCFEAINGVYTSLKTLYEHEKKTARTLLGQDTTNETIESQVLCKQSGRPRMHVRRHVGLQLDYWRTRHLLPSGKKRKEPASAPVLIKTEVDTPAAIDIDGEEQKPSIQALNASLDEGEDNEDNEDEVTYSLSIECEYCPPTGLYQTIRVSSHWLSENVSRRPSDVEAAMAALDPLPSASDHPQEHTPELQPDWQDPPFPHDSTSLGSTDAKPSQARFVAKFNPPLLVPLRIAIPVYASVGVDISHEVSSVAWHAGMLDRTDAPIPAAGSPFRMTTHRTISKPGDLGAAPSDTNIQLDLSVPRAEPARLLDSMPFVHPKQLVALLPVLRQYALLGSVLRNSFVGPFASPSTPKQASQDTDTDVDIDLDTLMADEDDSTKTSSVASLSLRTDAPAGPRMAVAVPTAKGIAYADVDFLPGGTISVSSLDAAARQYADDTAAQGLARGLATAEDLGVWTAWAGSVL